MRGSQGGDKTSRKRDEQDRHTPDENHFRRMQERAANYTPQQRRILMREWTRLIESMVKVILVGVVGWVIQQAREHGMRAAAVSLMGATAVGATQIAPAVETHSDVPHAVTTMTAHAPGPPAPAPLRPTATVTMTPPAATVTAEPHIQDVEPSAAPVQTEATEQPAPEPTHEPTLQVPTTPEPTEEPTWVTAPPVATSEPTLPPPPRHTPTASPTSPPPAGGQECVDLPDRTGVAGQVCEPTEDVDPEDRWHECLDEELLVDIVRCVRNPDVWFS